MRVLLSIKPEFSNKILSGEKKYEFRKQKPKEAFNRVYIYESSPTKTIVGWFNVKNIISGSPEEIWAICNGDGGIEKERFMAYSHEKEIIHAFEIDKITRFDTPVNPYELNSDFFPPQNFAYLDNSSLFNRIEELHGEQA